MQEPVLTVEQSADIRVDVNRQRLHTYRFTSYMSYHYMSILLKTALVL